MKGLPPAANPFIFPYPIDALCPFSKIQAGMKILSANFMLAAILLGRPAAAGAAVELSGWWTSGWPKGGALAHYGYGIITTGEREG